MYTDLILLCAAALAAVFDLKTSKIPNIISFFTFGALCLNELLQSGLVSVFFHFAGALLICALLFPFFAVSSLGAGDIKLMAALSAGLSFHGALIFLFASFLWGAALGVIRIAKEGSDIRQTVHLAPAILLGISTVLLLGAG